MKRFLELVLFGLVTFGLLTLCSCEKEDELIIYNTEELIQLIKTNQLKNYPINKIELHELRENLYSKRYKLEEYLNIFLWESKQYGLDLSYIRDYDIILEKKDGPLYPNNDGVLASGYALGMGNDELIHVVFDSNHFNDISTHAVFKIIFHELGHDILNLGHISGNEVMNTKLNYNKISLNEFITMLPPLFIIE